MVATRRRRSGSTGAGTGPADVGYRSGTGRRNGLPIQSAWQDVRLWLLAATALLCACADKSGAPRQLAGADPKRGLAEMERVGCAACHDIPGITWPRGTVGGSLKGVGGRALLAGRHPNQPDVMTRWIRDAPSLSPGTAMPAMPVNDTQARDIAAYLYTLDDR
jgi:sulfur-oxidizing protein SoxX